MSTLLFCTAISLSLCCAQVSCPVRGGTGGSGSDDSSSSGDDEEQALAEPSNTSRRSRGRRSKGRQDKAPTDGTTESTCMTSWGHTTTACQNRGLCVRKQSHIVFGTHFAHRPMLPCHSTPERSVKKKRRKPDKAGPSAQAREDERREMEKREYERQHETVEDDNQALLRKAEEQLKEWLADYKRNPRRKWKLGKEDHWCRYCGASKASAWGVSLF